MIYTAIDTFYVPDEQLENSPSRKDGIDESTEMILRVYGCDLIQESGILLKLPQASMATGQVLFHRFYCKKSFARYNVKLVAASCIWLAAKLEESPRKAKHVFMVFHRMELRRASKAIEQFDFFSTKYTELKAELNKTERQILKEMGFVCHVEHPHKFIPTYLETLGAPKELRQEAWNLANDSLRTTLCVRFKSEIVACGVVYAAARRFQLPLPEDPPWWKIFGAEKPGIDEVCRVLAKLYSLPKAQYVPVCKEKDFVLIKSRETKMRTANGTPNSAITASETRTANPDNSSAKELVKVALEINKAVEDTTTVPAAEGGVPGESGSSKSKADQGKGDINGEKIKDKEQERDRSKGREREDRERDRGRDSDREKRDRGRDSDREIRDKYKDRSRHRSNDKGKDSGYLEKPEKPRHHSSRDRDYHGSSYLSSREKDRHRHIH